MAIPKRKTLECPLLKYICRHHDGDGVTLDDAEKGLAKELGLSQSEIEAKIPNDPRNRRRFRNELDFAASSLRKNGLISIPSRGKRAPTEAGIEKVKSCGTEPPPFLSELKVLDGLRHDLYIKELDKASPTRFEKIIETMLRQMGYGVTPSKQKASSVKFLISLEHSLGSERMCVFVETDQSVNRKRLQQYSHEMKMNAAQRAVVFSKDNAKSKSGRKKPAGDNRFILVGLKDLARLVIKHEVDITKQ